ncbi:MAG: hypothetical protein HY794_05835 [Desulfarculus sp.]|nr:hypothetical protein [Desulfarculus sp.]
MAALLTQAEYARHRAEQGLKGQTPAAVNKKIKAGQLTVSSGALIRQDGKVLVDPTKADAEWAGNTDPALQRGESGPEKFREQRDDDQPRALVTLNEARSKREGIRALKEKIGLDQLRGTVLERAAVEDTVFQAMRLTRDQLRVLPSKLAPRLANLDSQEACRKLLENEVRTILDDLSQRFRSLGDLGPDSGAGHQPAP